MPECHESDDPPCSFIEDRPPGAAESGDGWNSEDFSLLGPGRTPRHVDIAARPYPLRSSAEPVVLSFSVDSRHSSMIFRDPPVEAPTVVLVPWRIQYPAGFEVRATSPRLGFDMQTSLLWWWPDAGRGDNQIIISPLGAFARGWVQTVLPGCDLRLQWPRRRDEPAVDTTIPVPEAHPVEGIHTNLEVQPGDTIAFEAGGRISSGVLEPARTARPAGPTV